jgi:hypothetical protein
VTHILRPGKASEKTPKGVIPPSLCEILQNALRKRKKKADAEDHFFHVLCNACKVWFVGSGLQKKHEDIKKCGINEKLSSIVRKQFDMN